MKQATRQLPAVVGERYSAAPSAATVARNRSLLMASLLDREFCHHTVICSTSHLSACCLYRRHGMLN
jgi:hypothetical protein